MSTRPAIRSRRAARERMRRTLDRPATELLTAISRDREALVELLLDAGVLVRDLDDLDPDHKEGAF